MTGHVVQRGVMRVMVGAALAAMLVPVPAAAQIGGLIKKAAKQAVGANQNSGNGLPSSAFGPELTEQTLSATLSGLESQSRILDQRDGVARQRDAALDARAKLLDGHDADHQAFDAAMNKWRDCVNVEFGKMRDRLQAQATANALKLTSDPAAMQKFQQELMATQVKMSQLMAKGDTAGAMALGTAMARKQAGISGTPQTDTAQAAKTCGAAPAKPAWLTDADANEAKADALGKTIRDLETKAETTGASTAGLPVAQYANARERIMNWYRAGKSGGTTIQQFSDAEVRLFKAHKAQIEKLERVL